MIAGNRKRRRNDAKGAQADMEEGWRADSMDGRRRSRAGSLALSLTRVLTVLLWRLPCWALLSGLCISLLTIAASPAHTDESYYKDGYLLRQECDDAVGVQRMFCLGYIAGVRDALGTGGRLTGSTLACVPGIRLGQAELIVKRYLETHPQYLHANAADIVTAALSEAFPCSRAR
jgi:hypothetical protein